MKKVIRITTYPISFKVLLKGQMKFISKFYNVLIISSEFENELKSISETEGVAYAIVNMTRKITPLKDLFALIKLIRLFKKEKPNIVHTHTPKAGTLGMIAARLSGVPTRLHTVAGLPLLESKGMKRIILDLVEKITYRCATMVYPNSKGLYDIILKNEYCNPEKLKVIGNGSSNGIDTQYFNSESLNIEELNDLKKSLGIGEKDFVFIYVGRLVGDKGINELVLAFKDLQSRHSEMKIKLLLVGPFENDLDPLFLETINEIESNRNIIAVGFQSDVRPFFAISNALAFPTYREGFPNVVMQAGAMGLPSIVTNINGCNEIIRDGENGLIIEPKNSNELVKSMELLLVNNELYNHLRNNSRKLIVSRFEQKVIWEHILYEYKILENAV